VWPDGAEFEALANIYSFCAAINAVYPPGCVFEIISDGHVFSDCIGVDDGMVTQYNLKLQDMAETVRKSMCRPDLESALTFSGLADILEPNPWIRHLSDASFATLRDVEHPVKTVRCDPDDLHRGTLLQCCSADHAQLQRTIRTDPSSSMTMLYRGFSRFMLDDLAFHADCKNRSKSHRKRMSEKVALEMMKRNQAYSHLVEMTMPRHVRLSIHAHNNKGPKFAISLLPRQQFAPLTSFDRLRLSTKYDQYDEKHHLHIPTPWHNCLVEVEGEDAIFVCKAGLVKAELTRHESVWSSKSGFRLDHLRGGRYMLYRKAETGKGVVMAPSTPEEDDVAAV
jgi:pyoverdine/dityrosine biosynthesis protein Dit1